MDRWISRPLLTFGLTSSNNTPIYLTLYSVVDFMNKDA